MNVVNKIEHWGDEHRTKWLDMIRIALGLLIFFKGIALISNHQVAQELIYHNNVFGFSGMMASVAIHIVAFVHLVGGLLITIGLLTRFAVVIQIPILLCAIFFVNIGKGFTVLNSELWLSVLVLILLIVFWVVGSGPLSVDESMKRKLK
ncbi:DoxX family protein [Pedobacter sp.]|uniref:DoxX family protein n=1 Tax=Pedobacter sp. TaxID=1411316 RepID=UPI003D7FCBAE